MARRSDLSREIEAAMSDDEEPRLSLVSNEENEEARPVERVSKKQAEMKARRIKAMNLKMMGLSWEQIGEGLDISASAARELVNRNLERADQREVEAMRAIENARLDRAQAAIWQRVLEGDLKAIDSYLKISQRRARINGIDAPQQIDLSVSIRNEMEDALRSLEQMVLGEVIEAEVIHDSRDDG